MKDIKFTDCDGENVIYCSTKVLDLSAHLDSAGAFYPNLLCNIIIIFVTTM